MLRRPLAVALLFVHAMAAAHLALAAHATSGSGAVVDAQPSCSQPRHGSTGVTHAHAFDRDESECQAVALARTAAFASSEVASVGVARIASSFAVVRAEARPPLAVLRVAPKSSPPV